MKLADLEFATRDGVTIATLRGEVDLPNATDLGVAIAAATSNEALGVVLDLSGVDYLDSAGIHLIYRLRESLQARGQALYIVVPEGSMVTDTLRLSGVDLHLGVAKTLEEAMRAVR